MKVMVSFEKARFCYTFLPTSFLKKKAFPAWLGRVEGVANYYPGG